MIKNVEGFVVADPVAQKGIARCLGKVVSLIVKKIQLEGRPRGGIPGFLKDVRNIKGKGPRRVGEFIAFEYVTSIISRVSLVKKPFSVGLAVSKSCHTPIGIAGALVALEHVAFVDPQSRFEVTPVVWFAQGIVLELDPQRGCQPEVCRFLHTGYHRQKGNEHDEYRKNSPPVSDVLVFSIHAGWCREIVSDSIGFGLESGSVLAPLGQFESHVVKSTDKVNGRKIQNDFDDVRRIDDE